MNITKTLNPHFNTGAYLVRMLQGCSVLGVQCFEVQRFDPALLCDCVLPDGGPMCSDELSFVIYPISVEPSQLYTSKCRTIVGVQ